MIAIMCLLITNEVAAQPVRIEGTPTVVDGDTIKIHGISLRLLGIDAPESDQAYGSRSTEALWAYLGAEDVACQYEDVDRYGRPLVECGRVLKNGDISQVTINGLMVRNGHAFAALPYGYEMERKQSLAMKYGKGMWGDPGKWIDALPWVWRREQR